MNDLKQVCKSCGLFTITNWYLHNKELNTRYMNYRVLLFYVYVTRQHDTMLATANPTPYSYCKCSMNRKETT